jgi:hypothetical protein
MRRTAPISVDLIKSVLGLDPTDKVILSEEKSIATLWAGYGTIGSFNVSSQQESTPVIVKRVNPPGNSSSVGDQRKVKSYHIEAYFYQELAPLILNLNKDGVIECPIANPYHIETKREQDLPSFTFLLSDLTPSFGMRYTSNTDQVKKAVFWLAAFHSLFYSHPALSEATDCKVWNEGGYWHLKTRLDELEMIPSYHSVLKTSAFAIDKRMNDGAPSSFTLVHGDFKEANILFGKDDAGDCTCAAVDFQYCGRGHGAKDLVMFAVSSVSEEVFRQLGEDGLLRFYADELKRNLYAIGTFDAGDISRMTKLEVLKSQYELALVDYVRFMAGWGFWGSGSDYAERRAVEILKDIASCWSGKQTNQPMHDLTRKDWEAAVYEKYPLL